MRDLSVLIPARQEEWLGRTIADVLKHREADTEVIAVLDGAWPTEPLAQHSDVQVIHRPTSIGQRAATNLAARLSRARYVMKLDAHCSLDQGFDRKLIEAAAHLGPETTQIPAQKNLHVYDWLCIGGPGGTHGCDWKQDQGPTPMIVFKGGIYGDGESKRVPGCPKCGGEVERQILWMPRPGSTTVNWRMDADLHFQYWKEAANRKEPIHDTMTSLGACFFMTRERFWEFGGLDEACGSWGQFGVEIACKSWLSGGRQVCNARTWFAHFFRVGGIGFPYEIHASDQEKAREYSRAYWRNNSWPGQIHPFSWLVEKFWPVPGWTDEQLAALKDGKPWRAPRGIGIRLQTTEGAPAASEPASSDIDGGASGTGPHESGEAVRPAASATAVPVSWNPVPPPPHPTKGIVYYSDCRGDEAILDAVRAQLRRATNGHEIVSATLLPVELGRNIVLPLERSYLTMFCQILTGLEASTADVIFFAEHDVLYHPSHFTFTPPRNDRVYYNVNVWKVSAEDGRALHYDCRQTSGLCAYRELLVQHYRKRVAKVEAEGFSRRMGFEPGTHNRAERVDDLTSEEWRSEVPNVDIRHRFNLTPSRWKREAFRDQRNCRGWAEAKEIPGWGRTAGRFGAWLQERG